MVFEIPGVCSATKCIAEKNETKGSRLGRDKKEREGKKGMKVGKKESIKKKRENKTWK